MLYEDHVEQIAGYAARRTARDEVQDVVAETFLTAWRRFTDLPDDPLPWLFVTARNVIANRHRSLARRRALDDKLALEWERYLVTASPGEVSDVDRRLVAAIAALPEAEREAFMLVAWDGLDAARAARAAGCNAATFRMRLHRARRRLKQQIGSEHPIARLTDIEALEESR